MGSAIERTIKIRQGRIVLVFDKHVAEFDFGTVHVLSNQDQFKDSSSLYFSMGQYVADLGGEPAR